MCEIFSYYEKKISKNIQVVDEKEECFDLFGLSTTLKMHIISVHLDDYLKISGKTSLYILDEHDLGGQRRLEDIVI